MPIFLFSLLIFLPFSFEPSRANSICDSNSGFSQEIVARWCGAGGDLSQRRPRSTPAPTRPVEVSANEAEEIEPEDSSELVEEESVKGSHRGPTKIQETNHPSPQNEKSESRICTARDKDRALELLQREHPGAYRLVKRDLKQFRDNAWWTDCNDSENLDNLIVALHETVHMVSTPEGDDDRSAYPLIDGKGLRYLSNEGFFRPYLSGEEFPKDTFKELYFLNKPEEINSAQEFPILLDELNAYTHGLHAANVLHKYDKSHQWRAGTVALMSFVKAYITKAGQGDANGLTWRRLNEENARRTIQALFFQAEKTVIASCRFPSDGQDRWYLNYLCKDKGSSLERILGRRPVCFSECNVKARPIR